MRLLRGGIGNDKAAGLGPRAGRTRVFQAVDAVAALEIRAEAGTSFFRVRWRRARCGAPRVPARGRRSKPFRDLPAPRALIGCCPSNFG